MNVCWFGSIRFHDPKINIKYFFLYILNQFRIILFIALKWNLIVSYTFFFFYFRLLFGLIITKIKKFNDQLKLCWCLLFFHKNAVKELKEVTENRIILFSYKKNICTINRCISYFNVEQHKFSRLFGILLIEFIYFLLLLQI